MPKMRAVLVSTYDLGHQPFGLASPAAWLRREGAEVICLDLAKGRLSDSDIADADFVAFHLPMHTATRLAAPVIKKVRALNPRARLAAYGLYAPLNRPLLASLGVTDVIGGEFEGDLAAIIRELKDPSAHAASAPAVKTALPKLQFLTPDRSTLPPLARYATLLMPDGERRVAGYTEATRGCRHLCRHCPVVPIYAGQFRVVQPEVVRADIAVQVAAGAQHITFGDPDFFNGPTHARRIVETLHRDHPALSYDVTIKVEHLLQHRDLLPVLVETGCVFVTTAVESLDDRVLERLDKGHTREDFLEAVRLCASVGVTLSPTFVAFHPWTTLESYCDLLTTLASLELVDHVAPIQLAIRLLIPNGSRLLELDEVRAMAGRFDDRTLTYLWSHADSRVDDLHQRVSALVGRRLVSDRRETFAALHAMAHEAAGIEAPAYELSERHVVPHLDEPWYCCAEPNPEQLTLV
jgi:radical SAM superfamily enzyme YgiQ (UPF0313 family)